MNRIFPCKKPYPKAREKPYQDKDTPGDNTVKKEESAPGEQLTIEQVRALLKTSRNFSGLNLSGMKLTGMNLSKCNLRGVDLRNSDLERADLSESDLERANLGGANLKMTTLRLSGIVAVNFENVKLDGAIWLDGRICARESTGSCR